MRSTLMPGKAVSSVFHACDALLYSRVAIARTLTAREKAHALLTVATRASILRAFELEEVRAKILEYKAYKECYTSKLAQ